MLNMKIKKVIFLRMGGVSNSAPFNRFMHIVEAAKLAQYEVEVIDIKPVINREYNSVVKFDDRRVKYDNIIIESVLAPVPKGGSPLKKAIRRAKEKMAAYKILKKKVIKKKNN